MPYVLEFYSLDWAELGKAMGSGDHTLVDHIDQENGDNFFRGAQDREDHLIWRKVLEALICGRRGKSLAERGPEPKIQPEETSDIMALALVGMIRALGTGVGELGHSTASGSFFREEFLGKEAPLLLKSPINLAHLISRPLFGIIHETYPSWGGLKKTEIKLLLENLAGHKIPPLDDSDMEAWLYDLYNYLRFAYDSGTDIVTVYS